ncbi:Mad3/BUB1 homology region 1-domain-containing protein [Pisolithus marmoratus]|nr:Mad3/BUB1 homology region 1-domain-containing protein [Pisolithus marmoratus]
MADVDDDVFTQAPPAVDIEVIEAAKENIQPLASGRRVTALSAILSTPHAQREQQLLSARKRHRLNVEIALQDDEDDPLEAYVRFVNWILDNYPQGQSAESGLLELLEEATRALKDNRGGIWKGELKYLKLWLLYAAFVEKPILIFKFLLSNDIGTSHAVLYEEYAAALERAGRRNEADGIFLLGIARQASPLEHLQSKHAEFQKRMMSGVGLPPAQEPTSTSRRPALGLTASSVHGSSSSEADIFGSGTLLPGATPSSRLQIFMDPTGSEPQEETRATFPDIGTRKSRVKENVPEVRKAAGTTLKHTGRSRRVTPGSSSSSTSKIIPYKDPGPEENTESDGMPPPPIPSKLPPKTPARNTIVPFSDHDPQGEVLSNSMFTPFRDEPATPSTATTIVTPDTVMKTKIAGGRGPSVLSEAEALRKDPLKNYPVDECSLVDD